jgi:hypothetical protein
MLKAEGREGEVGQERHQVRRACGEMSKDEEYEFKMKFPPDDGLRCEYCGYIFAEGQMIGLSGETSEGADMHFAEQHPGKPIKFKLKHKGKG